LKAVVLLSGGLDSVVNLKCAADEGDVLAAVTCDYGQPAADDEIACALACAERFGIPHHVAGLEWYAALIAGSTDRSGAPVSEEDLARGDRSLLTDAWLPNRNSVLLSVGAAYAEALGAGVVVAGFNLEEARVFPDNSAEFVKRFNSVLELSTLTGVVVRGYTVNLDKKQVVALGIRVGAPLDLVYSCYGKSRDGRMCGVCQSCMRLKSALAGNGLLEAHRGRFVK
jgi:7-cyano-7-deazaguanine synthase